LFKKNSEGQKKKGKSKKTLRRDVKKKCPTKDKQKAGEK